MQQTYSPTYFNSLPTIEAADSYVRNSGKLERALQRLGSIFLKHKMHPFGGMALLHNHFKIEEEEFPLQVLSFEGEKRVYTTTPRLNGPMHNVYPAIIKLDKHESIIALEYSNDPHTIVANNKLIQCTAFLMRFTMS